MKHYKAPNKRIIHRNSQGRFRKTTLTDIGIPQQSICDCEQICLDCGHRFSPVIKQPCRKCGSENVVDISETIEITEEIRPLVEEYKEIACVAFIDPFHMNRIEELNRILSLHFKTSNFQHLICNNQ